MKSCIVKRKFTLKALLPPIVAVAAGMIAFVLLLKFFIFLSYLALAIGLAVAAFLIPGALSSEYEYNLEGEVFSVALIRNKSSRKELFSCDIAHLVSCEGFTNQPLYGTKLNFSENTNTLYLAVFNEEGKQASVIFSPDEAFVRELRLLAPSKVKVK